MPNCEILAVQPANAAMQPLRWDQLMSGVLPSAISVGASPFTYQNPVAGPAYVLVQGGTVTTIQFSRDGSNFFTVGLLAGMFHVNVSDFIRVTYVVVPTMILIPF